ncbi:hypothetical protein LIER_20575 [Lithospermum erythrorhizon]|uniref:Uncharacterized protein n=1 Tax=Lithospermum erythrorhizon TaxID=34254 RepID=A0AAV3QLY3_LITER
MGSVETYGLDWEKAEKATLNKSAKFVVHLVAKVASKKDLAKYSRNWKFEKRVRVDESGKWTSDKRGLTAFFIWLSLRTSNPKCSLQDIYIPALNQTANSTLTNHNITLNLKFKNVMKDKSVRYDDLNLTLLYYSKNNSQTVGNKIMKGFKQGHSGKSHKQETVEAFGVPWDEAEDAAKNKSAVFGVSLSTKIKFKIMFWYTKKHHWRFEANVTVDDTGKCSDGGVPRPRWWCPVAGFLVILYFTDLMF